MNEVSDYEDCGCGKCCLPTILAERDEAMNERDEALKEKTRAQDALRRAEEHERETLRDLDNATAERDAALLEADRRAAESLRETDAAKHEAMRCQDDNERLRISLSVAVGLLSEIQNWRHVRGTTMELPVQKFLAEMRAGLVPDQRDLRKALRRGEP